MYNVYHPTSVPDAVEIVKKILAELPFDGEFQVIFSLTEHTCKQDGGIWSVTSEVLPRYIQEFSNLMGGTTYEDGDYLIWDYVQNPLVSDITVDKEMVILENENAKGNGQYPVIIVKKALWEKEKENLFNVLGWPINDWDFTSRISPALYIEVL